MCVPLVTEPVVSGPIVSELTDILGHVKIIGKGPVELGGKLVDIAVGAAAPGCDCGGTPKVIPSVVTVAPEGGSGIISLPIMILLGPMTTVSPFASVTV